MVGTSVAAARGSRGWLRRGVADAECQRIQAAAELAEDSQILGEDSQAMPPELGDDSQVLGAELADDTQASLGPPKRPRRDG